MGESEKGGNRFSPLDMRVDMGAQHSNLNRFRSDYVRVEITIRPDSP